MFASVDSRAVQKVWLDDRLIFDRARGDDPSALGLQAYETGAEDCSKGADEIGIESC